MWSEKIWNLYRSCFKDGEEIIIIDDDDKVWWGRLSTEYHGCLLTRPSTDLSSISEKFFKWEDVRFMSHDGFPVQKLIEADGSPFIEKIDTTNTQKALREILTKGICRCGDVMDNNSLIPLGICPKCEKDLRRELQSTVFGDPFLIEKCDAQIFNPGNSAPEFWETDDEEFIICTSKDGAIAHLFDIPTIYFFEA